ncbi:hypothetical protein QEG73_16305 [Chitinophagaceae bacterium 26-R-25]|nr:hypothetical protein [Chitinophagaceae bacterium 26-R-25]
MKKSSLLCIALAALILTCFVGCKKNEICLKCIPPDLTDTKILRYYGDLYSDSIRLMGTVNYNKFGDPVSILKNGGAGTGNPNCFFWYDNKRRLSDYIGFYNNNVGYEFWHRYYYDNKDRIVLDSMYVFGFMKDNKPNKIADRRITYKYDDMDRMSQLTVTESFGNYTWTQDFAYDERGNLQTFGPLQYDNKYNPHLLHKIWQFIEQDYSINNPVDASRPITYNAKGFPTSYATRSGFPSFLGQIAGARVKIDYSK